MENENNIIETVNSIPSNHDSSAKKSQNNWLMYIMFLVLGLIIGAMAAFFILKSNASFFGLVAVDNQATTDTGNNIKDSDQEVIVDESEVNPKIENLVFTNKNLGKFSFTYPNNWEAKVVKEFGSREDSKLSGEYFPKCNVENCMATVLSNESLKVNLFFNVVFDDMSLKCSNTVTYQNLKNEWFRVKDSEGFLFTKNATLDYKFAAGYPMGKITDEWSAVENEKYKICVNGTGMILPIDSAYLGEDEGAIMLEHIKVSASASDVQLEAIKSIVESMKF